MKLLASEYLTQLVENIFLRCGASDEEARLVAHVLVDGLDQIFMPGQRSRKTKQERLAHGIPLVEETWRQIKGVAQQFNVPL